MRCRTHLLAAGLVDQSEAALGQVAQAAVQQPAGSAAGAEGQIVLLDQPDAQAAHGRIAGDARPDDPAADHQHVEHIGRKSFGIGSAALLNGTVHGRFRSGVASRMS